MELTNNLIYLVWDEDHGAIAVASSVKAAIAYLINEAWLLECVSICVENKGRVTVREHFGENWKQIVMAMSDDEFNDVFLGEFYIYEETLYTKETVE